MTIESATATTTASSPRKAEVPNVSFRRRRRRGSVADHHGTYRPTAERVVAPQHEEDAREYDPEDEEDRGSRQVDDHLGEHRHEEARRLEPAQLHAARTRARAPARRT